MTLKIANTDMNEDGVQNEREIEEHVAKTDPSHRGYPLFQTFSESFDVTGPEGKHLCLAYPPMREPFWLYQRRFNDGLIPLPLVKTYILFLLAGLDYLHSSCRVVHTGNHPSWFCALRRPHAYPGSRFETREYHGQFRRPSCTWRLHECPSR